MQMFGVGPLELIVILVLAVIVIGPDRMPGFAADLARWIRRARAYATHLTRDFNEVIGEIEKEAGTSREDWKEIASVVGLHTNVIASELTKVATQVGTSAKLDETLNLPPPVQSAPLAEGGNVVTLPARAAEPAAVSSNGNGGYAQPEADQPPVDDGPWYIPQAPRRRRSNE